MHTRISGLYRPFPEDQPDSGGEPNGGAGAVAATFTQADMDRVVAERVSRERAKYADHSDLKAKASEFDKLKADQATETEKAISAAVAEAIGGERSRSNSVLIAAEARAQAAAAKFRDPTDALGFLKLSDVKVGDDGQVDTDAVKALLEDLAKSKPYLLTDDKTPTPTPSQVGLGVTGGAPQPTTPQGRLRASIEADIAAGRRP